MWLQFQPLKWEKDMKKTFFILALFGALMLPNQDAKAWEYNGISSLNPMPALSYLNPLPYFGIGENKTTFSLNPFTGFKNCKTCKADPCDPCKVKRTTCNECNIPVNPCPTCKKAFADPCPCNNLQR